MQLHASSLITEIGKFVESEDEKEAELSDLPGDKNQKVNEVVEIYSTRKIAQL